jgi:hypothetical protein
MRIPLLLLALAACTGDDPGVTGTDLVPSDDTETPTATTWTAEVTLAATATAGDEVPYTATLTGSDGDVPAVRWTVSSDVEADLRSGSDNVRPTLAATHTLTFSAEHDGATHTVTAALDVSAGPMDDLELTLDAYTTPAGQPVGWQVTGVDAWDNPTDATAATLTLPAGLTQDGGTLTSTVADRYDLSASLGDATDAVTLVVEPGAPDTLSLSLTDDTPGLNERVDAVVHITDAYGNDSGAPWTLTVDGPGNATVSGGGVTIHDQGTYTITVSVTGTALTESVTVTVDGRPPELGITAPRRGGHYAGSVSAVGTATDFSGVQSVTVDGTAVTLSNGSYSHPLSPARGVNLVETVATDMLGQSRTDKRAYLHADLLSGDTLDDAFLVRIEEGPGGTDMIETLGEDLVAQQDLDSLIPSPLYDVLEEDCYDVWFDTICVDWYGVTLDIGTPTWSATDLEIDPRADGTIAATVSVRDLWVDFDADVVVTSIDIDYDGHVEADSLDVVLVVRPTVTNGQIGVDIVSVSSSASGFYANLDSWVQDALEFFGYDITQDLLGFFLPELEGIVRDEVPPLLEEVLQDLELETTFDLVGAELNIAAAPSSVTVTDDAMVVGLSTEVWASGSLLTQSLSAPPHLDFARPSWGSVDGLGVALSLDFVNQLFYAVQSTALLDLEVDGAEFGITPSSVAFLFPGLTQINLVVESGLPPVAVPGSTPTSLTAQLGSMRIAVLDGPAAPAPIIEAYLTAEADVGLAISGTTLTPTLGTAQAWVDVIHPAEGGDPIEDLIEDLVPALVPLLTDVLTEIEIPEFEGFSFTIDSAELDGPDQGYFTLSGELEIAP